MNFEWNIEKNNILKEERGVCFEDVVIAINQNGLLDVIQHPNQVKYPGQQIYIIEFNVYVYMVPFIKKEEIIFLKTIIPSRKMKQLYKGEL
ncbi:MAG: toxin [Proteobacteria bacterium]|nr:toxin [Pseudomonadota bacterium]